MKRTKRNDRWWIRAAFVYEYAAVSIRSLAAELAIDRPYLIDQIRRRGWQIVRTEGTAVELRKLHRQAASKPGQEDEAAHYQRRIEAVEDTHAHLVRMVRACEANPAA